MSVDTEVISDWKYDLVGQIIKKKRLGNQEALN